MKVKLISFNFFRKWKLFSIIYLCCNYCYSQSDYDLHENGFYSLNGPMESSKRYLFDDKGNHYGKMNFKAANFENVIYQNGIPYSGVFYQVIDKRIVVIGELKNGLMSGILISCNSDISNEDNYGQISDYYIYLNGKMLYSKNKIAVQESEVCNNRGVFVFNSSSELGTELIDKNGRNGNNEDFNIKNGIFNKNRTPFSGVCYLNEMGVCFYFLGYFKNGFETGLMINSNEGGYISSFGEMAKGKKNGKWITNSYTGGILSIGNYLNNQKQGEFIFFSEDSSEFKGKGSFNMGKLLKCSGSCEEY